ncbi:MAG: hypothetical protein V4864_17295 [Pseudomonadota bacterium]
MRAIFGALGLLIVVAIVGLLAKKQLTSAVAPPAISAPAAAGETASPAPAAPAAPKAQVQQFKQNIDAAAAQTRPLPDEAK